MLMRVGILVDGVVVVAVRVMVVAVGMLMRAGILVGGMVVVAVGIVSFSEERYLFVTEVEYWRVRFGLVGRDIDGGGYIGAAAGQGMDVGDGGGDGGGSAVVGDGRDACVWNGGVNEGDCCRFSGVI